MTPRITWLLGSLWLCMAWCCGWAEPAPRRPDSVTTRPPPEGAPQASPTDHAGEDVASENRRLATPGGGSLAEIGRPCGLEGCAPEPAQRVVRLRAVDQDALDGRLRAAVESGLIPGGVLVLGRADGVTFQRAYGLRDAGPPPERMTLDTIFDLASLTKPLVTATAVLQLAERGQLELDAPIARYLPAFAAQGKTASVRQVLLHTSGLPAVDPLAAYLGDRAADLERIASLAPETAAGRRYLYSDLGYIVLGALVEQVSHQSLDEYARTHILLPLGMSDSAMGGVPGRDARVAPTEERFDAPIRNVVDDPRAYRLGGSAGNAGLFSTAGDLARFARMMLGHGSLGDTRVLSASSVANMTRPTTLPGGHRRGLGWQMHAPAGSALSAQAFGHGGYTGSFLFIDPAQDLFVVLLTNVVHGGRAGTLAPLRRDLARLAVEALPRVAALRPEPTPPVRCGVDVLRQRDMRLFDAGAHTTATDSTPLRVGLLTHGAARTRDGLRTVDLFVDRPEVALTRIFTPEHGLDAQHEGRVRDGSYRGVPVVSLFGRRRAPTLSELSDLDALVVDLVDVGTRFYTYPASVLAALRAAAAADLRVVILDRPDPLGGVIVEGPVSSPARRSFVNSFPLPIRHGLTLGELAQRFVSQLELPVRLSVIGPTGWRRGMRWAQTGLAWTPPSPNLPSPRAALLYAATGLVEGANVSVGRGTDTPFEVVAAPYLHEASLAARLEAQHLPGVRFETARFRPRAAPHRGRLCRGVRLILTDESAFRPVRTGFALLLALHAEAPRDFDLDATGGLVADDALLAKVREHVSLDAIEASWQGDLAAFTAR